MSIGFGADARRGDRSARDGLAADRLCRRHRADVAAAPASFRAMPIAFCARSALRFAAGRADRLSHHDRGLALGIARAAQSVARDLFVRALSLRDPHALSQARSTGWRRCRGGTCRSISRSRFRSWSMPGVALRDRRSDLGARARRGDRACRDGMSRPRSSPSSRSFRCCARRWRKVRPSPACGTFCSWCRRSRCLPASDSTRC